MNRIHLYLLISSVALFIGCGGGGSSGDELTAALYDKVYEVNTSLNNLNPKRGFYKPLTSLDQQLDYDRFQHAKDDGFTLVYTPVKLYSYTQTATLPDTLLQTMKNNLDDASKAGVELIVRIQYRDDNGSDPAKDIILGHLQQFETVFAPYQDTIYTVEAGCIGAYGEWHSFSGDFVDTNPDYKQNRKAIIEALMRVFPSKYIHIRTPMHKELLFGSSNEYGDEAQEAQVTPSLAYSTDIRAKIAHHNDCFLASFSDKGTYESSNVTFWKDYVANDTEFVPLGGETCLDESTYTNCDNAQKELKKLHWSFLNVAYHPDVIDRWKTEGCYDTIANNLGYNFVADGLNYSLNNDTLHLELFVTNRGYANLYEEYQLNFVLYNTQHSYRYNTQEDLREWKPSQQQSIQKDINLTQVVSGEYTLGVEVILKNDTIRFSNAKMWDENQKINKVLESIHIP